MTISAKSADRRIQRTRQLLQQASIDVMREKGFQATSIQEIAKRANVSRGTFYAHFADKYALLETLFRAEFQKLIDLLPPISHWNTNTLQQLTRLLLENFRDVQRRCHPLGIIDPLIVNLFQEELAKLFLAWLRQKEGTMPPKTVSLETIAQTMSWVILGTALQWSQEPGALSSEQMAENVLCVLLNGVAHFIPGATTQ